MTACRSAGPNELTKSCVVGVTDGEAAGSAGDFDGTCGALPPGGGGAVGAGDCAARLAARIEMATEQSSNLDFTMICRC